jgi:hypothetical protein
MKKFKLTSIAALTALMILSGCAGSKKLKSFSGLVLVAKLMVFLSRS